MKTIVSMIHELSDRAFTCCDNAIAHARKAISTAQNAVHPFSLWMLIAFLVGWPIATLGDRFDVPELTLTGMTILVSFLIIHYVGRHRKARANADADTNGETKPSILKLLTGRK